MKLMKQIVCTILTLCLCAGLFIIPSTPVSAATNPSVPKNVDVFYYKDFPMVNDYAIAVQLGTSGRTIKNLKTSNKNLKAKVTSLSVSSSQTQNSGYIGVYAKKTGTYKVSFDVYNAKNTKVKSLSVKVRVLKPTVSNNNPFKKLTFDGNEYDYQNLYSKGSVKINVTMNKGYKLKSIKYRTYGKPKTTYSTSNSKTISNAETTKSVKKIKNNMSFKLNLGHYANYSASSYVFESTYYNSEYHHMSTGVLAPTTVVITYQTKDKQTRTTYYTLYRIADDVK